MTTAPVMRIGNTSIGDGHPTWIVAEYGINWNGDPGVAKSLVDMAARAECQAVKGQKRTIDVVYSAEELAKPRPGPWGETNGDLKRLLEMSREQCADVQHRAAMHGMSWSASPWDVESVQVLSDLGVEWVKVASASITDEALVRSCCELEVPVVMSTGMSDTAEIDRAVEWVCSTKAPALALLHTCSTYPSATADLHLSRIEWLRERYGCVVGYSGHETGVLPSVEAVRLGAAIVERHITLDRSMWGSDQSASLEPAGLSLLVRSIRALEAQPSDVRALGPLVSALVTEATQAGHDAAHVTARARALVEMYGRPGPREVLASEVPVRAKLRRVGA